LKKGFKEWLQKKFIQTSREIFGIKPPKKPRKDFTPEIKELILIFQNHQCATYRCFKTNYLQFDHIRDHSNNTLENCQALCLECHERKTITDRERKKLAKEISEN